MMQRGTRRLLQLVVMEVVIGVWSVSGIDSCDPLYIESMKSIDYKRVSGEWYVVGRDDIGYVSNELWNARMALAIGGVERFGYSRCDMPSWYPKLCGTNMAHLDFYGRMSNGICKGRNYIWGALLEGVPGLFQYKLVGSEHFSMMYILDTDYHDFAVLAHCVSGATARKMHCVTFNLFLLKRQRPESPSGAAAAAAAFDTTVVKQRLKKACTGSLQLRTTQNEAFMCIHSQVSWHNTVSRAYYFGNL